MLGIIGVAMVFAGALLFAFPVGGDDSGDADTTASESTTTRGGRLPSPYSSFGPGLDIDNVSPERPLTTTTDAEDASASPLADYTIVLDPGHNGGNARNRATLRKINREVSAAGLTRRCDSVGTTRGDFSESAFNLAVARLAARQLRELGATVKLTRSDDRGVGPCVDERAALAAGADAFISIHADEVADPEAVGFHLIYPAPAGGSADPRQERSELLAAALRDGIQAASNLVTSNYLGHDGLDRRRDLLALNAADAPAVVLEAGNPASDADLKTLARPDVQAQLADGLVSGLAQFLNPHSNSETGDR